MGENKVYVTEADTGTGEAYGGSLKPAVVMNQVFFSLPLTQSAANLHCTHIPLLEQMKKILNDVKYTDQKSTDYLVGCHSNVKLL